MQKKAIHLITFFDFDANTSSLFSQLKLLKLQDHIKLQTLYFMHQFFIGKLPKIFDSFLLKLQISIMSTLALQLGQLFTFQKFEQTMVNLIFDTTDLSYGTKLMRDLRFLLPILSKVNYQCISLICIKFYY